MARKNPVRVIRSGLTGTVYALTNYRERENGLLQVNGQGKHDVTADVEVIVAERCAPLVERLDEAERLLARARLVMDHLHRDGIGEGFIKTREDIAAFLGLPSQSEVLERKERCAPLVEAIEAYIAFCKRGAVSPNVYFWAEDALRAYREREGD